MKLKADGVRGERATGKPGPSDRALALFNPQLACAVLILATALSAGRAKCDDEANARIEFARMPLTLATTRRAFVQLRA